MPQAPNLTLEPVGGKVTGLSIWYSSAQDLCVNRNIPRAIVRRAKEQYKDTFPGFRSDGRINWTELQPWFAEKYPELMVEVFDREANGLETEREVWELRKLKAETISKERANLRTDANYILRKLVLQTLAQLASAISTLLRQRLEMELPQKCAGMGAIELRIEMTKLLNEILSLLQKLTTEWTQKQDLENEPTNTSGLTDTFSS